MQKNYYKSDSRMGMPSIGMPMHAYSGPYKKPFAPEGEIITPHPPEDIEEKRQEEKRQEGKLPKEKSLTNFGKGVLGGRFETDDIILLCIIFLLLQSGDEPDFPLLLALGYIFFAGKDNPEKNGR